MSSRTLDDAAIETLLRTTTETLGAHFATDQTMRGDRLGLSVAATVSSEEAAVRASDRIGEPLSDEQGKSLGSLPILRLDRTFGSAASTSQPGGAGASASSSPSVASADLSSDFQPVRVLGEGGMGQVILARQSTLDREVAVKRTKAEVADASAMASLLVEARIMGALEHPNIVPVHLLARDAAGHPVLVMKRIEGTSWRDLLLDPDHPFWQRLQLRSTERLVNNLEVLMQVCTAAHFAHSRGVVHRDIKPENVMLGAYGEVYLVDWGIAVGAKAPARTSIVGTPAFMAPEMLTDPEAATSAVDVYLLGATLHYLVTGRYRHEGSEVQAVLRSVNESREPVYGDDVPSELAAICRRAMARDPRQRFGSADEVRAAIADYLRHRSSIQVCEDGQRRLNECRLLLAGGSGESDARLVHQLLTEARFAFDQALREWPQNHAAQAARQQAIGTELDFELACEHLENSQRLISLMPQPTDEQRQKFEALAAKRRARDAEHQSLAELRHQNDPTVGLEIRTRYIAVVIVLMMSLSLFVHFGLRVDGVPSFAIMFSVSGAMAMVAVGLILLLRRTPHYTTFNRRAVFTILVAILTGLGIRILSWRFGISPPISLIIEQLFFCSVFILNGITLHSSIAWGAAPQAAGVVLAYVRPEWALVAFTVGGVLSFIVLGLLWRSQLREESTS